MAKNKNKTMKPVFFNTATEADLIALAESKENFSEWVKSKLKSEMFVTEIEESIEVKSKKQKEIIWKFPENKKENNND